LKRSNETKEGSRELETISQNEREQQRAGKDKTKRKRAAESLNRSNTTKEGSRELEPIKRKRAAESLNRANKTKESSRELEPIKRNERGQQRA
jgi:hypothetical protein